MRNGEKQVSATGGIANVDGLMSVGFWGGLLEPFLIAVREFRPKVHTQYLPRA